MKNLKKLTIKELRQRCQSNAPEAGRDPLVGLTLRFFSIYITKFLFIRIPITSNQITVLSVLVFLSGISLFALNSYWLNFVGAFLVYLSVILDGCDGEIARLKGNKKHVGGLYTEPISHDIQYALMFIPLAIGVYMTNNSSIIIWVAFIATVAKLLQRFFIIRFDQLLIARMKDDPKAESNKQGSVRFEFKKNVGILHRMYRWFNRNIFSSVGLIIPLLFFSIIERIDLFIWLFAIAFLLMALLHFVRQVVLISRMSNE